MALCFRAAGIAAAGFAALTLATAPANATFFGSRDGPGIGLGTACAALMEGVARQPELAATFTETYRLAASAILAYRHRGQKDVPQGIALYRAEQLGGVARQPEAEERLKAISDECGADLAALRPSRPDRAAVAIGQMCAALLENVARLPQAESKLLAVYDDGLAQIAAMHPRSSTQVKAEAIGIVAAAAISVAARQSSPSARLAEIAEDCTSDIRRY